MASPENVNKKNEQGETGLIEACKKDAHGTEAEVKKLLEKNASVTMADKKKNGSDMGERTLQDQRSEAAS